MKTKTEPYLVMTIDLTKLIEPPKEHDIRKIDIDELGKSILAIGLLNPITVVKDKNKKYRILAGRRRYWACRSAKITNIICSVVQTDDASLNEVIEVTENLLRVQLTPMQQANAIQKLRNLKMTDESIAANLGMTPQFVARRAKLLDLSKRWQGALLGKPVKNRFGYVTDILVQHWPVACLELIARYDKTRQDELITALSDDIPTIEELKTMLSQDEHKLLSVPWDKGDESLYPKAGSCASCPKRSDVQPLLFDDEDVKSITKNARCLDNDCFQEKMRRHADIKLSKQKEVYPDAILVTTLHYRGSNEKKTGLLSHEYEVVKKKTKGAKLALMVDGNLAGRTLYITTGKTVKGKTADAKKKPITDKDRAQRLRNRRNKWIIDKIREDLRNENKRWPVPSLRLVVACAITFGLQLHDDGDYVSIENTFKRLYRKLKLEEQALCERFWWHFRQDISRKLCVVNTGIIASKVMPTLNILFDMMGTSFGILWAAAAKEIPDKHNYLKERPDKKPSKKKGTNLS